MVVVKKMNERGAIIEIKITRIIFSPSAETFTHVTGPK
jgi:hypothetical protein